MADMEKIISKLDELRQFADMEIDNWDVYLKLCDLIDLTKDNVLVLLKEQEAKEQCLKTKCIICPHCDNCDVDENGLLKEQEPVPPDVDSERSCSCGNCGTTVGYYPDGCKTPEKLCKFCPECGRAVKWK